MWSTPGQEKLYEAHIGSVSGKVQPVIFCVFTNKNASIWLIVSAVMEKMVLKDLEGRLPLTKQSLRKPC